MKRRDWFHLALIIASSLTTLIGFIIRDPWLFAIGAWWLAMDTLYDIRDGSGPR